MALTKVNRSGLNTGISDSSDATFLTVDSSEQAVIKSEGGAVTASVQQGLVKVWNHYDQNTGNDIRDSFNVSSVTDVTTGGMKTTYTNAMNNNFYSVMTTCEDGGYGGVAYIGTSGDPVNDATEMGTTLIEIQVRNNYTATPSTFDPDAGMIQVAGDLA